MKNLKPTPPQKRECCWISVEDRLPKQEALALVFTPNESIKIAYHHGRFWWHPDTIIEFENVTHWMDLPEGPK